MTVLIANKISDRVRGCLKTWFIEPKCNVFISNLNDCLCQKIVEFLSKESKKDSEFIVIQDSKKGIGFKIIRIGRKEKRSYELTGLNLF